MTTYQYTPDGAIFWVNDDGSGGSSSAGDPLWDDLQAQIEAGEITVAPAARPNLYPRREQEEALMAATDAADLQTRVDLIQRATMGVPS